MRELSALTRRNTKLFFKDKGMFFTSLITPIILLVLYATFLGKVYKDSITSNLPDMIKSLDGMDKVINGFVGNQLFSSILAVSCITVAFCSNMIMVQDKVNGVRNDLNITPVKSSYLSISYYISTAIITLIVCISATAICFIYIANVGWYISIKDVFLILLDIFLLVMFGTALSSIINIFISSQGQISAVGTIVSSGYGFICGAYMPISQFGDGLQKFISFFPGTYGTSLLRNHVFRGVFKEMEKMDLPSEVINAIKDSIDCNLYFYGNKVELNTMYIIVGVTVAALISIYIILNYLQIRKNTKK